MNRAEKAKIIDGLKEKADKASIAIVTDFHGLKVAELTPLRAKLHEAGCDYQVVKNTLARIAFTGTAHEPIGTRFKENCAVALGFDDPVAVAKALTEFAKTSKLFAIRHGSLEGKALSADQVSDLAKLPSKPELLARALGTMNAVPTNFVSLFANIIRSLLYVLKDLESKKAAA